MDNEELKTETRSLKYDFTASEILDLSHQLAEKNNEFNLVDAEKKTSASQYSSKLKSIGADMDKLSTQVHDGHELREVDCEVLYHHPTDGRKTLRRKDTGIHLPSEPMEQYEFDLFNQGKSSPGDDEAEFEAVGEDEDSGIPRGFKALPPSTSKAKNKRKDKR